VLEDYGDVSEGFLTLYAVTGEPIWVERAGALLETALGHFADGSGGFFDTPDDGERLVRRPQDPTDGAVPSGQSAVAGALLTFAAYTGSERHRQAAERALHVAGLLAERAPRFAGWHLAVAEALADGPSRGGGGRAARRRGDQRATRGCAQSTAPGVAVAVGAPGDDGGVPCSPAARTSVAGPRRTSAGTSRATRRSPTSTGCAPGCGPDAQPATGAPVVLPVHGRGAGDTQQDRVVVEDGRGRGRRTGPGVNSVCSPGSAARPS
jgi:hypothetical protein